MRTIFVVSLIYSDKRDTGIHFQGVGETAEAAIDKLNVNTGVWRDEHFGEEPDPEDDVPCLFQLDGAWVSDEPSEPELPLADPQDPFANMSPDRKRCIDVQEQLNRWLMATMDDYVANVSVHYIIDTHSRRIK